MYSCQQRLRAKLRDIRKRRQWTQVSVSRRAGFTQSYLSQVECGFRPISATMLERLEHLYGFEAGTLWAGVGKRGRRRIPLETRRELRKVGRAIREFIERDSIKVLPYPQPHQTRRRDDPLAEMAFKAAEEVRDLERDRGLNEIFWRNFNSIRFDSWSEKRLLVRVALTGATLLGLRMQHRDCALEIIDGRTDARGGVQRTFVMSDGDATLLWSPQVAVHTQWGYRCLDNLLIYSAEGRNVTLAVEVEGSDYHSSGQDARRQWELGIPVLGLDAGRVGDPDVLEVVWAWARERWEMSGQ